MNTTELIARNKELASLMTERATLNPVSCKLLNEAWRKDFPDEVAVARRILALVEALESAQRGEQQWKAAVEAFCADDAEWHKLTTSSNELISTLAMALSKQADRIAELEARTVTLPDVEKWRSVEAVRAQNAYRVLVINSLVAAGIKCEVKGE